MEAVISGICLHMNKWVVVDIHHASTQFIVRTVDMPLWQSVMLEESDWDVNQHLFLPVDCVFKYSL
jgi:hypothetical protein